VLPFRSARRRAGDAVAGPVHCRRRYPWAPGSMHSPPVTPDEQPSGSPGSAALAKVARLAEPPTAPSAGLLEPDLVPMRSAQGRLDRDDAASFPLLNLPAHIQEGRRSLRQHCGLPWPSLRLSRPRYPRGGLMVPSSSPSRLFDHIHVYASNQGSGGARSEGKGEGRPEKEGTTGPSVDSRWPRRPRATGQSHHSRHRGGAARMLRCRG
jgi:hypothetical protein